MNVVDSSCWLEYFAGSPVGAAVAPIINDISKLIVPSISLYEVFRKVLIEVGEDAALMVTAHMKQARLVELDADLSIFAAKIGLENKLPLADSIIYATCIQTHAMLWTQDRHFKDLKMVKYFEKQQAG